MAAGAYSARRTLVPTDLTRGYGDWGESANTGPELSVKKFVIGCDEGGGGVSCHLMY